MVNKRVNFLMALLFLNTTLVFSHIHISGLLQYGINIDRQHLHLTESQHQIHLGDHAINRDYMTSTYIIKNSGSEYNATIGILLYQWMGGRIYFSDIEIRFFVDGSLVAFTERTNERGIVAMDGHELELLENRGYVSWALIDVLFPENSTVTIRIQHQNIFTGYHIGGWREHFLAYNPRFLSFFPDLLYWKGPTEFSVEIVNDFVLSNNVQDRWISDIIFERIEGSDRVAVNRFANWLFGIVYPPQFGMTQNILRTSEYLRDLQSLETNLMRLQRLNSNTFRIDFTEEFMVDFTRSFVIDFNILDMERFAFVGFNLEREVILTFLHNDGNISQRELAPYELFFLTSNQLRVMRNTFFARHGFVFSSMELQTIFEGFNIDPGDRFYVPNPNFHEGMLTDIDRANIAIIQRLEALARD
jgi:hypothetical protein